MRRDTREAAGYWATMALPAAVVVVALVVLLTGAGRHATPRVVLYNVCRVDAATGGVEAFQSTVGPVYEAGTWPPLKVYADGSGLCTPTLRTGPHIFGQPSEKSSK